MLKPNAEQMCLLKACLLSGDPAQEAWKNWADGIDFENMDPVCHKLLPLAFRNPSFKGFEDPIFLKCQGIYRQTWAFNQVLWKKIHPLLEKMLAAGVEKIVLLKGMAMILHHYQDFGMRVIGDVDILVRKDQLPIIDPILRSSGWKQNVSRFNLQNPEHLNRWHALNLMQADGTDIDLHWSFIQENCPKLDEAVLKDAVQNGKFYVPCATDLLLQTCVHGVKYSPVPLIRWIPDAMTILRRSEINWDRLVELGKEARLCLPLSSALQFLADQFDAPIPQTTIQKLKEVTPSRLEQLEYKYSLNGYGEVSCWFRYCLNRGYESFLSQALHLHKYLATTARLPTAWLIPIFAVYWIFKRAIRKIF